jgi:uncharacterized DUF497 family protein
MKITHDATKGAANLRKHGVPLALAERFDWSEIMASVDNRRDYGELREAGFALQAERHYCVVFTQRGDAMQVINVRGANKREVRRYVEQTENHPPH